MNGLDEANIALKRKKPPRFTRDSNQPVAGRLYEVFFNLLFGCGVVALLYYFSWWLVDGRLRSPLLILVLIMAIFYGGTQLLGNWYLYALARRPAAPPRVPPGISVDVFLTAYKEPYEMIERSLTAACNLRGEHCTWLLDDDSDPALEALAKRLGAGYLCRQERTHAKAGNLNSALSRTDGDIIAIFDIDHVPRPDFLERSLGYFSNPQVGFVQVMLTFNNREESWVAQAAMETSLEFYNPTSLGADRIGGTTMMGSNAIIRRAALNSIRGYQPGLAEDLATSVNLHAAGWRSAYVAEPLAPGQAPPSFTAWFVQQLKWARGVFELLLTTYPRLFPRLTWGQRLSYAVRMTKYWIGPALGLHLFATIAILIFGDSVTRIAFHQYLIQITPLAVMDVLIRFTALHKWRHPSTPRTSLTRAIALVYASWPIYLLAWMMAILRLPLSFHSTPKTTSGRLNPAWLLPQFLAVFLLSAGMLYTVVIGGHRASILLVFAILQGFLQLVFLSQWLSSDIKFIRDIQKSVLTLKNISPEEGLTFKYLRSYVDRYSASLQDILDQIPLHLVDRVVQILHEARLNHRQIFILGNGGSALTASHFVWDLMNSTHVDGWPNFRVSNLAENPAARFSPDQDVWCENSSSRQLAGSVRAGDVVIGISTDNNSPDLIKAIELVHEAEAKTIAFTSLKSGRLGRLVDINLYIPNESTPHVEDVHLILERLICERLHQLAVTAHISANTEMDIHSEILEDSKDRKAGGLRGIPLPYASMSNLNVALDPPVLLQQLLQVSMESLDADSGSLFLINEEEAITDAFLAYAGAVESFPAERLSDTLCRGLAGWVMVNRQPAIVCNTFEDPRWLRRPWEEEVSSRSAVSIPLLASDRVVGVLTLAHNRPNYFTARDLELLIAVGVSSIRNTAVTMDTHGSNHRA